MVFACAPVHNCMCIHLSIHVHKKGFRLLSHDMTWDSNSLQEVVVIKRITVLYFFVNDQIIQVNMASVVLDKAVGCYILIWIFLKLLLLSSVFGAPYGKGEYFYIHMKLCNTILICDMAWNLIAINRLRLTEVQDLSQTAIYFEIV